MYYIPFWQLLGLERDGLRQTTFAQDTLIMLDKSESIIPDRSSPGSTRTAPAVSRQDGGDKCTTGTLHKIRARDNIAIATWNIRTLAQTGRLQELTHEMEHYTWHILGLCEVRWKALGEHQTEEGHILYYSGELDKSTNGVGFLVNKDIKGSVLECRPISSRIISIRLKASPFNISIIQVYAPTTDHDDEEIEEFYNKLQGIINMASKKDILIIQGDWNAKVGKDAIKDWADHCGPSCNERTNERGRRLLEFASYNNLVLANTLGRHKASRCWTWHAPNGIHHNQIDYILVHNRYQSGINREKTRTFPGADVGSDHDLVIMNFRVRLKKISKPKKIRLKFNLEQLKDPDICKAFQATIGGKFAPLLVMDVDVKVMTDTFSTVMTTVAKDIIGLHRPKKKPWVTEEILNLCDARRDLKNTRHTTRAVEYREINKNVRKSLKKAKEDWIGQQCTEIESSLSKNNSKKAFQIVKDLTRKKQPRVSTIQDENGTCLTEANDIAKRWTDYCKELYNHPSSGDPEVLKVPNSTNNDDFPILKEEVEFAIRTMKDGKAAGVDNIPAELIKNGGESVIELLTQICNKIWQTGEWPTQWTQSLIITLPKKGNLQLCQNYRTISLISHASKVMLKIILNRLNPQAEEIIAEEQAGFRSGRSTTEQIFNLRLLCEKYSQHQQDIYHVFIDFKKAFDRVWHEALWATMKKYNMGQKLTNTIKQLYAKATSAVIVQGSVGDWFKTTVGVRQGCLLSPTLFNIYLERIMSEALENHCGTVSIGGRNITNLRFADDIDGLAGNEDELATLVKNLDEISSRFDMEISAEKTKLMTNSSKQISTKIKVRGKELETVSQFKYLGSIITEEGSRAEILSRAAQTTAAMSKLRPIWKDKNICLKTKIRLLRALVISIFLYSCEAWTLTAELQRRIQALEMRCYRTILGISYMDHITNEEVRNTIRRKVGQYEDLLTIVKRRKLKWYGHVTRANSLSTTILQGTVQGGRRRGRQRKKWSDNITEWTRKSFAETQALAHDRVKWRELVRCSAVQCLNDHTRSRD